ncbi:MAG: hypothetical protein ABSG00_13065 [Terracidiphilus sp.]|jgi:hypothetical protein
MTLLDAPEFDYTQDRRRRVIIISAAGVLFVLIVGFWLVAGHPVDLPWNWNNHLRGRMVVKAFFTDIEKNDLPAAYGVWTHDKDWQRHPAQHAGYPFDRFEKDWGPMSPDNDYGPIHSYKIAAATMHGNVLLMALYINGRKSKALDLDYDPKTHSLNFSPDDVQLYLGP